MSDPEDFECALTGKIPAAEMLVSDDDVDPENIEDTPLGWVTVRVIRRGINPKYAAIQQVQEIQFQGLLANYERELSALPPDEAAKITDEMKQQRMSHLQLAAEAAVFPLLNATPKYVTLSAEAVVVPPETSGAVAHVLQELLQGLDLNTDGFLPPAPAVEGEDNDEEDNHDVD